MTETEALIHKAHRYLRSADVLLRDEDCESCVSRIYYAMFYAAQAVLLTRNLSFSSHKGVISAFGEHFIKTDIFSREMGRELNRAFEKRQLGDYGHSFTISSDEAVKMLESGMKFVETIARWLDEQSL